MTKEWNKTGEETGEKAGRRRKSARTGVREKRSGERPRRGRRTAREAFPREVGGARAGIPVFVPDASYREAYLAPLISVIASGQYSNFGPMEEHLAGRLRAFTGIPQVLPVSSGDMALYLALSFFRLGAGTGAESQVPWESARREVITTPFTFPSTVEAILRAGFRPVFADIDPVTRTLSPASIREKCTPNTAGILPVHVYGTVCDTEAIGKIAGERNLFVLYDAAHAFGERRGGRSVLSFGDICAISTHATKTFHTVEGGCLFSGDGGRMEVLRQMANFGLSKNEGAPVEVLGCNAKMNEFEAAVGLVNLDHFEAGRKKRRALDARYRRNLAGLPGIRCRALQEDVESSFAYFPVFVTEKSPITRDELREALRAEGIRTRRYFYPLVSESSVIRGLAGYPPLSEEKDARKAQLLAETPVALAASREVLCLPFFDDLRPEEVDRICRTIRQALAGKAGA